MFCSSRLNILNLEIYSFICIVVLKMVKSNHLVTFTTGSGMSNRLIPEDVSHFISPKD